jgi:hypothetical protein
VVTSPLSKYRKTVAELIGDGTIMGYGSNEEAAVFIRTRRPPAVILVGDLNGPLPDYLADDYHPVHIGSTDPKDADFGIVTLVRAGESGSDEEIELLQEDVDITDI